MSRRNKKTPFPPWQTCKADGIEARYIRLSNSQLSCRSMQKLPLSAFKLYVYMLLESGGHPTFEFPHAKASKILSNDGFRKALSALIEAGFVEIEQANANLRKPNIYRFSDRWKTDQNF